MAAIIDLQDIVKNYQTGDVEVRAVRGVSLTIQPGEFVAIMGASGSGKSTMMNILGCLDQPTSGLYLLDGTDVSQLSPEDRAEIRNEKIGFVFQGFNLLSRTTTWDNIELPMLYAQPPSQPKRTAGASRGSVGDRGAAGPGGSYAESTFGRATAACGHCPFLGDEASLVVGGRANR